MLYSRTTFQYLNLAVLPVRCEFDSYCQSVNFSLHFICAFYFLLYKEKLPGGSEDANFETAKFDATHVRKNIGLWKGDADGLKPCWVKPSAGKTH